MENEVELQNKLDLGKLTKPKPKPNLHILKKKKNKLLFRLKFKKT